VVAPGETVTYTAPAGLYRPGEAVTESISGTNGSSVTLVSTGSSYRSWSKAAAADGSLTFTVRMPMDGSGDYILVTKRADGSVFESFTITVVAPAAATGPSAGGTLAKTGSTIATYTISGVAALLLIAGAVLLVVRRRRSSRADRTA
jgi:LPXTG-motif cell wall-anchored protein